MAGRLVLVVAAALVDRNGRIFVQKRPDGKAMAGLWEFPGGKIEAGEAPVAALVRELHEELGIDVRPEHLHPACFGADQLPGGELLLLLYLCRQWSGHPHVREADEGRWVSIEDVRTLPMPPADGPMIDLLERLI